MNACLDTLALSPRLALTVCRKQEIAHGITLFELAAADHGELPAFEAGAHIAVTTPNGLLRRYSLCNPPSERQHYVIAVKRDELGAGGSKSMVDELAPGSVLAVAPPENYFPLARDAQRYLLIAGGIGITPLLSMVHELRMRGADFELVYCARFPESTAFLDELAAPDLAGRVRIHHSHGDPARAFAVEPLLAQYAGGTHVYCCGPRRLMQAVREAARHWPAGTVHLENFGTSEDPKASGDRLFSVRLERTGITVAVPPGTSILEALRNRGVPAPSSCESGTCGSCRTRLLAGKGEHRDYVLDEDEHDAEIMICVSRAQAGCEQLVLDL
ncbi:PDR/VanB family oxidoreductase [Massilia niastensis]|uniref:PDR/VanB family oxidoreductase n=1 Tax=Massilia niastensis TaxID=544911 RepID=UPI00036A07EC|nr:PDR/VanB family oxidoreductase [Massilia niastensis]